MTPPPPQTHLTLPILLIFSLLSLTSSRPLSPENHLLLPINRHDNNHHPLFCESWRFTVEANDAGKWSTIPSQCFDFVKDTVTGDRFLMESKLVAVNSLDFAKSVDVANDGKDAWVFDVDETLLFNLPYYQAHGFGSEVFNEKDFDEWTLLAKAPVLPASLSLYKELQQLGFTIFVLTGRSEPYRNATVENLQNAGYTNWEKLILREPSDNGKPASVYKSERRQKLVDEGYRIRGNSGDQWSDLLGFAIAERSFKLPNPMYYIP